MTDQPTTPTKYGPASYSISADGCLSLQWPALTVNRVQYGYAHAYETRDKYRPDRKRPEVFAHRKDGKETTLAALIGFREELERLAPVLVSPEACARARVEEARARLAQAERDSQAAQEREERARAEFAAAVAAAMEFFAEATT